MAQNPVLGKLQGQGLFETTTAGIEQAGGALAVTPVGAAMQGRGPDSQKMAGTQPAKINALRAGLQDVQSQALGELRERGAGELTAEQQARVAAAKSATVLGRVDDRIAKLVQDKVKANLAALSVDSALPKAQLDIDKLPANYKPKETVGADGKVTTTESQALVDLRKSIGDLISGTDLTDTDIKTINDAILAVDPKGTTLEFDPAKLPSAPVMAASLSSLFKNKSKEELTSDIGNAIASAKAADTIGALQDEDAVNIIGEGKTKADLVALIASVTGKKADTISDMQLAEVRAAIQNWKDTEFKDVAKLRQDLNSPMTSPARRQLALTELRRLGQLELTAAEAKVGNLEQQMKEGDEVRIGTEVFTVEELFKDPAKLLQLQTWADNPETAPTELKAFLTANAGAIQSKVTEIIGAGDTGLTGAIDAVKTNTEKFKLDDSIANKADTSALIDTYFPGWGSIGLDDKKSTVTQADIDAMPATTDAERAAKAAKQADLDKTRKYELLQNRDTAQNMTMLMGRLGTIPDGKKVFEKLTYAQMQLLASDENRVNDFVDSLNNQNSIKNFKGEPATLASEFEFLTSKLGLGISGKQLSNLINKNLYNYKDIFKAAGLSNLIDSNGKFNFEVLRAELNGLRDANYEDLINFKATSVKNSITKKVDLLFSAIGNARRQYTAVPELDDAYEASYRKREGLKHRHPDDIEADVQKEYKIAQKNILPEINELTRKLYSSEIRQNTGAYGTIAAEIAYKQGILNSYTDKLVDLANNKSTYLLKFKEAAKTFHNKERKAIEANNARLQERYDNFANLLRGAA